MPKILFTSDTHYGHKNIIDYCTRPFTREDGQPEVELMNQTMITRWNERVVPEDTVYHLGDFGFGSVEKLREWRSQLNGKIILVKGNHDRSVQTMKHAGFDEVVKHVHLNDMGYLTVFLRHHPKLDWKDEDGLHLCGHVHESWSRKGNIINVGVDVSDFYPLTLQELLDRK